MQRFITVVSFFALKLGDGESFGYGKVLSRPKSCLAFGALGWLSLATPFLSA
jgi:hypothetical protein